MHAHTSCSNRGYQSRPRSKDYFSHLIKQRVSRFDDDGGDNRILPCSDCCCCYRAFRRRCHSRVPCELPDHDACLPDFRAGVATYPLTLLYHLWILLFLSPIWVLTTFFITDSIHDSSHRVARNNLTSWALLSSLSLRSLVLHFLLRPASVRGRRGLRHSRPLMSHCLKTHSGLAPFSPNFTSGDSSK